MLDASNSKETETILADEGHKRWTVVWGGGGFIQVFDIHTKLD